MSFEPRKLDEEHAPGDEMNAIAMEDRFVYRVFFSSVVNYEL